MKTFYRRFRNLSFVAILLLPSYSIIAATTVGRFKPIEIPVPHSEQGITNLWDDVSVSCLLKAPDGTAININGFYHSKNLWMVRYAPDQAGMWHYEISVSDKNGQSQIIDSFQCIASNEQGFIRLHPNNPKRWIYSSTGNLYTAVGFGDCMGEKRDSIFSGADLIDGGFRPKGYHEGIEWILPYSQYLTAYGDAAGFNIYRFSDGNCAYSNIKSVSATGNNYDTLHLRWTDTLFYALRKHGFRIFMTILGSQIGNSSDNNSMAATFRYIQHCIDRYGSLVDFWELTNESSPDSLWVSKVVGYIHANDPYHHLVSMSWQLPNHPDIDIISPHWYGKEDVRNSDQAMADQIGQYKNSNKPVIFGEQGQGLWDSLAAIRMRGRIWSALFNESTLIFWNSSFAKDCDCNEYLGWEERRYARVLQNFSVLLDSGVRKVSMETSGHLRIWELQSPKTIAFYIRDFQDVKETNSGRQISFKSPVYGTGYWYDVHSGDILEMPEIGIGQQTLTVPNFQTDIAFIARFMPVAPMTDTLFHIDVNPRTEMLLNIPVKTQQTFTVLITNVGKRPITIEKAWTSSPSKILSLSSLRFFPYVLPPSQSIDVPIQYMMSDTGGTGAMFSFQHDASPAWENIAISATGIQKSSVKQNQFIDNNLEVFPDPAMNVLHVNCKSVLHNMQDQKSTIQIFSIDGKEVAEQTLREGISIFDVSRLPPGTYNVVISVGNSVLASKKVNVIR